MILREIQPNLPFALTLTNILYFKKVDQVTEIIRITVFPLYPHASMLAEKVNIQLPRNSVKNTATV